MEKISKLLKLLESEMRLSMVDECSQVKFMYGCYFSEADNSKIIGESVAVVSATGLDKFVVVSLVYSPEDTSENKIVFYGKSSEMTRNLKVACESFLSGQGIPYVSRSEDV